MPGFSKTLKERFKNKWAKKQTGAGSGSATVEKTGSSSRNLATRRVPVIEKRAKKSKKRSKKQQKRKKR